MGLSENLRLPLAAVILSMGAFICAAGIVSFRMAKTTVNPLKPETASSLVDSGIYQFSRNPMYVGFAFALTAWALWLSSLWALGGVVVFVLYMNKFQIQPEEKVLAQLFGDDFTVYQAKVRRWL